MQKIIFSPSSVKVFNMAVLTRVPVLTLCDKTVCDNADRIAVPGQKLNS